MKRLSLLLLFLTYSITIFAQNKAYGVVMSEDKLPLSGVIITAYNNNKLLKYTVSSANGSYTIVSDVDFTRLDFYIMGYKRVSLSVDMKGGSVLERDIMLKEDAMQLPSVTVKPEAIKVQGDTVTYDATSFVRNGDNSLKEVLNRVPNVSVSTNGNVKVQGLNINKFYIEDMDMLGDRYAIAVNNLNPNDISSISIYYNHQPIKALSKAEYNEQSAINIKLKEKAKGRWMYEFGGGMGAGNKFIYDAHIKAMRFGKKSQSMFIGKSNNSGEDIISETLLQNMGTGVYNVQKLANGGVEDLFHVSKTILSIPSCYYYNNKSNAVSILNLNNLKYGNTIKESIVFTTDVDLENRITKEIVLAESIVIVDSLERKRDRLQIEGDLTYTSNKENTFLENKLLFKVYSNGAETNLKSSVDGYSIDYSLPKIILNDNLSIVYKKGEKTRKLYGVFHYSNLDQQMMVHRNNNGSLFSSDVVTQNFYTNNFTAQLYSSFISGKQKSVFTYEPGVSVWYKTYESVLEPYVDSMYTYLSLCSVQPYFNMKYRYRTAKLDMSVSLPLSLRCDFISDKTDFYLLYNPTLSLNYKISSSFKINASASVGNQIDDIDKMSGRYIYTGYRNFYSYSVLPSKITQNYSASLNYSNYSSYFFVGLYAKYISTYNNVMTHNYYLDDYTFTEYMHQNSRHRLLMTGANIKKRLASPLVLDTSVEYIYNNSQQYIQSNLYDILSDGISGTIGLEYSPSDKFSLNYEGRVSYSKLRGGKSASMVNYTNSLNINYSPFDKLHLGTELHHYLDNSNNDNSKTASPFIDFSIEYKPSEKLSFNCYVRNMLNIKDYSYSYFSGYSEILRITKLRGAEFMVGFSYSL